MGISSVHLHRPVVVVYSLSRVQLLRPHGLWPARLLSSWDSPGRNTGVGCHFLLLGIFPTQVSNPSLLHCRQILYQLSYKGSPTQACTWFNVLFCCLKILNIFFLHLCSIEKSDGTVACEQSKACKQLWPSSSPRIKGLRCMGMAGSRHTEQCWGPPGPRRGLGWHLAQTDTATATGERRGFGCETGWDPGPFAALPVPGHLSPPATKDKETVRD